VAFAIEAEKLDRDVVELSEGDRHMDLRTFLSTCGVSLLAASLAAEAQPAGQVARIGYLSPGTATANAGLRQAFTDGLRHHGWIEGQNIAIEYRWEGAGTPTLDALAAELAQMPLDALYAVNTPAALATKRTGTTRALGHLW
jgi:putative ABC transport system substrate-binding protein